MNIEVSCCCSATYSTTNCWILKYHVAALLLIQLQTVEYWSIMLLLCYLFNYKLLNIEVSCCCSATYSTTNCWILKYHVAALLLIQLQTVEYWSIMLLLCYLFNYKLLNIEVSCCCSATYSTRNCWILKYHVAALLLIQLQTVEYWSIMLLLCYLFNYKLLNIEVSCCCSATYSTTNCWILKYHVAALLIIQLQTVEYWSIMLLLCYLFNYKLLNIEVSCCRFATYSTTNCWILKYHVAALLLIQLQTVEYWSIMLLLCYLFNYKLLNIEVSCCCSATYSTTNCWILKYHVAALLLIQLQTVEYWSIMLLLCYLFNYKLLNIEVSCCCSATYSTTNCWILKYHVAALLLIQLQTVEYWSIMLLLCYLFNYKLLNIEVSCCCSATYSIRNCWILKYHVAALLLIQLQTVEYWSIMLLLCYLFNYKLLNIEVSCCCSATYSTTNCWILKYHVAALLLIQLQTVEYWSIMLLLCYLFNYKLLNIEVSCCCSATYSTTNCWILKYHVAALLLIQLQTVEYWSIMLLLCYLFNYKLLNIEVSCCCSATYSTTNCWILKYHVAALLLIQLQTVEYWSIMLLLCYLFNYKLLNIEVSCCCSATYSTTNCWILKYHVAALLLIQLQTVEYWSIMLLLCYLFNYKLLNIEVSCCCSATYSTTNCWILKYHVAALLLIQLQTVEYWSIMLLLCYLFNYKLLNIEVSCCCSATYSTTNCWILKYHVAALLLIQLQTVEYWSIMLLLCYLFNYKLLNIEVSCCCSATYSTTNCWILKYHVAALLLIQLQTVEYWSIMLLLCYLFNYKLLNIEVSCCCSATYSTTNCWILKYHVAALLLIQLQTVEYWSIMLLLCYLFNYKLLNIEVSCCCSATYSTTNCWILKYHVAALLLIQLQTVEYWSIMLLLCYLFNYKLLNIEVSCCCSATYSTTNCWILKYHVAALLLIQLQTVEYWSIMLLLCYLFNYKLLNIEVSCCCSATYSTTNCWILKYHVAALLLIQLQTVEYWSIMLLLCYLFNYKLLNIEVSCCCSATYSTTNCWILKYHVAALLLIQLQTVEYWSIMLLLCYLFNYKLLNIEVSCCCSATYSTTNCWILKYHVAALLLIQLQTVEYWSIMLLLCYLFNYKLLNIEVSCCCSATYSTTNCWILKYHVAALLLIQLQTVEYWSIMLLLCYLFNYKLLNIEVSCCCSATYSTTNCWILKYHVAALLLIQLQTVEYWSIMLLLCYLFNYKLLNIEVSCCCSATYSTTNCWILKYHVTALLLIQLQTVEYWSIMLLLCYLFNYKLLNIEVSCCCSATYSTTNCWILKYHVAALLLIQLQTVEYWSIMLLLCYLFNYKLLNIEVSCCCSATYSTTNCWILKYHVAALLLIQLQTVEYWSIMLILLSVYFPKKFPKKSRVRTNAKVSQKFL